MLLKTINPFTGTIDLVQDVSGYVPYTGATSNVNLGSNNMTANVFRSGNASATSVAYGFSSGNDGMFLSATNTLGFATNGVNRLGISTSAISFALKQLNADGSAAAPSIAFGSEQGTGLYRAGTGILGFTSQGTEYMRIQADGSIKIFGGVPTILLESSAANATNAGTITMRTPGGSESFTMTFDANANRFRMQYGATNIVSITSAGFGLNTTAFNPTYLLDVISTGTNQFRLGYNTSNYLDTRVFSTGAVYHNAIGSSPYHEFFVNNQGRMQIGDGNVTIQMNIPYLFMYGADTGIYLSGGGFSQYESGVYSTNGDETIASYDTDTYTWYYFNRALYGNDSTIISNADINIFYNGSPQLSLLYDVSNYTTIQSDYQGNAQFYTYSSSIFPNFIFNNPVNIYMAYTGEPQFIAGYDISNRMKLTVGTDGTAFFDFDTPSTSAHFQFNKPVSFQQYTVSSLPAGQQGDRAHVTDALTPVFGATVVGGGSTVIPVFFDGSTWVCA